MYNEGPYEIPIHPRAMRGFFIAAALVCMVRYHSSLHGNNPRPRGRGVLATLRQIVHCIVAFFLQILFDNAESVCYHLDKVAEHFFDELRFCFGVYGIGL